MNNSLFFKICRLFVALILFSGLGLMSPLQKVSAQEQTKGITLDMQDVSLGSVMQAIEQQSDYIFTNSQVDENMLISIKVSNADINDVLKELNDATGITWTVQGTEIQISNKSAQNPIGGGK